jgi:hypothetical protein
VINLEFLDTLNGMIFIFSLITIPLFFTPFVIGVMVLFKKNRKRAFTIFLGYLAAIIYGVVIGFDESSILLFIVYTFFSLAIYLDRLGSDFKKRSQVLLLVILFFVGIGTLDYAPFGMVTKAGSEVTEQQMIRDLRLLASKKVSINRLELWRNGQHQNVKIKSESPSANIIMFDASTKHVHDNFTERFEVQEAMRIFMYLEERKLPFEVAGVHTSVSHKWVAAHLPQVLISKSEFKDIYSSLQKVGQDDEELVRMLSEAWIKKHPASE